MQYLTLPKDSWLTLEQLSETPTSPSILVMSHNLNDIDAISRSNDVEKLQHIDNDVKKNEIQVNICYKMQPNDHELDLDEKTKCCDMLKPCLQNSDSNNCGGLQSSETTDKNIKQSSYNNLNSKSPKKQNSKMLMAKIFNVKVFYCRVCNRQFKLKTEFEKHESTHSAEKSVGISENSDADSDVNINSAELKPADLTNGHNSKPKNLTNVVNDLNAIVSKLDTDKKLDHFAPNGERSLNGKVNSDAYSQYSNRKTSNSGINSNNGYYLNSNPVTNSNGHLINSNPGTDSNRHLVNSNIEILTNGHYSKSNTDIITIIQNSNPPINDEIHNGHSVNSSTEDYIKCPECDLFFRSTANLKAHYQTEHEVEVAQVADHTIIEKPFLCILCSKAFRNQSNLKKHYRTHSGEKPFECDMCFKCFATSYHLKRHARIHTGEKPFACTVCSKAFTRNSTLKQHLKTHDEK